MHWSDIDLCVSPQGEIFGFDSKETLGVINQRLEQEKMLLEKRLREMTQEAETNEKAWEYSQAQKDYEVGRLQNLVAHASNQNKQLRWNEETQAWETLKRAEQAMTFKEEAERLSNAQTRSAQENESMRKEAHRGLRRRKLIGPYPEKKRSNSKHSWSGRY